MRSFIAKTKRIVTPALVLLCTLIMLCSCPGPWVVRRMEKIRPTNFPNTVWSCREAGLVLYTIEGVTFGTYSVNGAEYFFDSPYHLYCHVEFRLYSYSDKRVSELDPSLVHYETSDAGAIYGTMDYEDETGNLIVKVSSYEPNDASLPETFPEKLTFEQTGTFGKTPNERWVAEELDLYLDSYSDTDKYYSGEIKIDGEAFRVYAREKGKYYQLLLITDNDFRHELVCLSFAVSDGEIVATRVDQTFSEEYWDPDLKTVTFRPAPIE